MNNYTKNYKWILYILGTIFSLGFALISKKFRKNTLLSLKGTHFDNFLFEKGIREVEKALKEVVGREMGKAPARAEDLKKQLMIEFKKYPFITNLIEPAIDYAIAQLTEADERKSASNILTTLCNYIIKYYNDHF